MLVIIFAMLVSSENTTDWFKYIRPKSNPQLSISNLTKKDFNCHFVSLWRKATALITLDHLPGYVHNDPVLKLSETSVLLSMKHQRFAAWQKRSTLHCLRRNEPVNCQIINEITDWSRLFLVDSLFLLSELLHAE